MHHGISSFSYWLLTQLPPFQTITLLGLASIGAMFFIRDLFEGLAYNTSRCALWGGCAVLGIIYLGISVLGRGNTPVILESGSFHLAVAVVSVLIAMINIRTLLRKGPEKQETVMDAYHNWVLLPGYIYLLLSLIPLILARGTVRDFCFLVILVIIYLITALIDMSADRLDQRAFLRKNGLRLPIRD